MCHVTMNNFQVNLHSFKFNVTEMMAKMAYKVFGWID